MSKSGYAGKVGHTGAQTVKALFPGNHGKSAKVAKGEDLRTGKKGGKK